MALVWQAGERSASFDRGKWTGTQNYTVYDDTKIGVSIYDLASTAPPSPGFGGGADPTIDSYLRNVGSSYTPAPDGRNRVWNVVYTFESIMGDGTAISSTDVLTETEVGFTSFECNINSEILDIWYSNPTLPATDALRSDPGLTPLTGGTPVYAGKDPISFVSSVMSISVRNVRNGRPDYLTLAGIVGKRNSAVFTFGANAVAAQNLVCPIGSLLFVGATTSRIGPNQYEVNYQFSFDPNLYFLRQVPLMDTEGVKIVLKTPGSAFSDSNPYYADKVYYKQPFPSVTAFSALGLVTT